MKALILISVLALSACASVKPKDTPVMLTTKCVHEAKPTQPISQHDKLNAQTDPSLLYSAALLDYVEFRAYALLLERTTAGCW